MCSHTLKVKVEIESKLFATSGPLSRLEKVKKT